MLNMKCYYSRNIKQKSEIQQKITNDTDDDFLISWPLYIYTNTFIVQLCSANFSGLREQTTSNSFTIRYSNMSIHLLPDRSLNREKVLKIGLLIPI